MSPSNSTPPQHIVIIGGGIIGVCTGYYLAIHPSRPANSKITIVEATHVAGAASGKAGGLLALDWHGQATASLSELSYRLHQELSQEHDGVKNWGYRAVDTLSVTTDLTTKSKRKSPVHWLPEGTVQHSRVLGTKKTTSQVHPYKFSHTILKSFLEREGTELIIGEPTKYSHNQTQSPNVSSVVISPTPSSPNSFSQPRTLAPVTSLILSAGPWTSSLANTLLPRNIAKNIGITGSRAHSIVLKTNEGWDLTEHALFTDMTLEGGGVAEPEVYTRPDGTAYVCGASDNEPLPAYSSNVKPSPHSISQLHLQASSLSPNLSPQNTTIKAEQACFLPIADRGRPYIGKVRGMDGVYLASGHSCWGICQGPGTGKVMSELVWEGKVRSADISKLAP